LSQDPEIGHSDQEFISSLFFLSFLPFLPFFLSFPPSTSKEVITCSHRGLDTGLEKIMIMSLSSWSLKSRRGDRPYTDNQISMSPSRDNAVKEDS
jgi:hypothetical protein